MKNDIKIIDGVISKIVFTGIHWYSLVFSTSKIVFSTF